MSSSLDLSVNWCLFATSLPPFKSGVKDSRRTYVHVGRVIKDSCRKMKSDRALYLPTIDGCGSVTINVLLTALNVALVVTPCHFFLGFCLLRA
jgi:hypothetical protein